MSKCNVVIEKDLVSQEVGFLSFFNGTSWSDLNRQFFDQLAPKYDRLNNVLSFGRHQSIKKKAISRLPVIEGQSILDLCTGSGDIAHIFAAMDPSLNVLGLDASVEMLNIATRKTAQFKKVSYMHGDALNTGLMDASFDGIFIGFGLRNLQSIEAGLTEMNRLLKPGGWLSILDLGKPSGYLKQSLYHLYFERWIPFLGKRVFHKGEFNSFEYLPKSNRYYPNPDVIAGMMSECHFRNITIHEYLLGGIVQHIAVKP
jgi:demethylmenaquinone methyltransferase/2-methoxy-6-polyprenyl-1,4-benzoquinol methylase